MKRTVASTMLVGLLATLPLACSSEDPVTPNEPAPIDYVMTADEKPFGKTYGEWAEAWWKWALAIPGSTNPINDGDCNQQQSGDVFFLAGNGGGNSARTCTIPAGKAIFFPIVNAINRICPEGVNADFTCDVATSDQALHDNLVALFNDNEITTTLEVDGHAITGLEDGRAETQKFIDPTMDAMDDAFGSMCAGPIRDNTCNMPVGSSRNAIGDGYWVMLNPLAAGKHDVHFAAKVVLSPDSSFELDVSYALTVEP